MRRFSSDRSIELLLLVSGALLLIIGAHGQATSCNPACKNGGSCMQELDTAAYYCDCSATGFSGVDCTSNPNSAASPSKAPSSAPPASPRAAGSTSPVPASAPPPVPLGSCDGVECQHGSQCVETLNTDGFHCDCNRLDYTGVACQTPLTGPAAAASSGASPAPKAAASVPAAAPVPEGACNGVACQHGTQCVQMFESEEFFCDCSGTAYTGVACQIPATTSLAPIASLANTSSASASPRASAPNAQAPRSNSPVQSPASSPVITRGPAGSELGSSSAREQASNGSAGGSGGTPGWAVALAVVGSLAAVAAAVAGVVLYRRYRGAKFVRFQEGTPAAV